MDKSVQMNCSNIHNRKRKKILYQENGLDSQREFLFLLKQMKILQLISAVPQFIYVRMKFWENFFRFVSPPPASISLKALILELCAFSVKKGSVFFKIF